MSWTLGLNVNSGPAKGWTTFTCIARTCVLWAWITNDTVPIIRATSIDLATDLWFVLDYCWTLSIYSSW